MSILAVDMLLALSLPQSLQLSSGSGFGANAYSTIRLIFFLLYLVEWVAKTVALGPSVYLCRSDFVVILDTLALAGVAGFLLYESVLGLADDNGSSTLYIHALLKI